MNLAKDLALVFWRAAVKLVDDGGLANASNIALSLLLSLFPFLMFIAGLLRLYGEPALAPQVVDLILGHWPENSAAPIVQAVEKLLEEPPSEFFSFGTVLVLLLATNGVENARDGLNRAYKVTESRGFLWRRFQGVLFVLGGALGLIVSAIILVGTPLVWAFLIQRVPLIEPFGATISLVQYGLSIAILWFVIYAFHRLLPNIRVRSRTVIWGLVVTIIGIVIGSSLFGLYLENVANYTALYAGLSGMMIAIVYLYVLSVLILYGAEFNAALWDLQRSKKEIEKA